MKVNINAWCRVKLTKHGLDIIKKECPWTLETSLRYNKQTKVYSDELWHLMRLFGECMWMGNRNNPFENNEIEIIEGT
jgi:hypothetical protein